MKKIIVGIIVAGVILFAAIQLIPVGRTNPAVVTQIQWDSPETQELARRACMDCHSNETVWPWYARIAPVSWLISFDVTEGRAEMNLSDLTQDPQRLQRKAEEIREVIFEGEMPPGKYLIMHPEAKLTEAEKQLLSDGLQKSISNTLANQ